MRNLMHSSKSDPECAFRDSRWAFVTEKILPRAKGGKAMDDQPG